jgi:hypothetical protein
MRRLVPAEVEPSNHDAIQCRWHAICAYLLLPNYFKPGQDEMCAEVSRVDFTITPAKSDWQFKKNLILYVVVLEAKIHHHSPVLFART